MNQGKMVFAQLMEIANVYSGHTDPLLRISPKSNRHLERRVITKATMIFSSDEKVSDDKKRQEALLDKFYSQARQ